MLILTGGAGFIGTNLLKTLNETGREDILVVDGLVWTGALVRANETGITEGRDPKTGEVKRTRPNDQEFFACGMGHGRCYRNKATDRFLFVGRHGVEMIPLDGQEIRLHVVEGAQLAVQAVELGGSPQSVDIEDDIAYVACSRAGVAVIEPMPPMLAP